jgi:ectoine hydroxylase-related dioxygenase (phytanoyl-CoA dioxygenase family)
MTETLATDYPLNEEQKHRYRMDGHIMLRRVAGAADLSTFRPALQDVVQRTVQEQDRQRRLDDYSALFHQVTNVWTMDDRLRTFVLARRFAGIAAALMGVPAIRLYHDQALFKPPGGKQTPWHQDQFYWPLDTVNMITMWMPLVDAPKTMGTMTFASGSHLTGPLVSREISAETHALFEEALARKQYPLVDYELRAGDATFHAGWTVHSAHANDSTQVREVMTIIYFADGAKILPPDNAYRKVDMEVFHPGQHPGDAAASPVNPLLYP